MENTDVATAWDRIVLQRAQDIESGLDTTYHHVILPWTIKTLREYAQERSRILDIGCGCGYLDHHIFENGYKNIEGIDISEMSVEYASEKYPHIAFAKQDISQMCTGETYDICLGIMLLNNMPGYDRFFLKTSQLLDAEGRLLVMIPHPVFWPEKHLQLEKGWYMRRQAYELAFSIRHHRDYPRAILYFHRPLQDYIQAARVNGLRLISLEEILEAPVDEKPDLLTMVFQKELTL